ncbi:transposase [Streptomyces sp. CA-179760]|uniref:transposase n=1 Tax=Streptomyces sp. CA-179760 TaxID=3240054 RepID=UPI003D8DDD74
MCPTGRRPEAPRQDHCCASISAGQRHSHFQRTLSPGIGPGTAQIILAGIGADMSRFPTPEHLVSCAKLRPHTIRSGGEAQRRPGRTGKPLAQGNPCRDRQRRGHARPWSPSHGRFIVIRSARGPDAAACPPTPRFSDQLPHLGIGTADPPDLHLTLASGFTVVADRAPQPTADIVSLDQRSSAPAASRCDLPEEDSCAQPFTVRSEGRKLSRSPRSTSRFRA